MGPKDGSAVLYGYAISSYDSCDTLNTIFKVASLSVGKSYI